MKFDLSSDGNVVAEGPAISQISGAVDREDWERVYLWLGQTVDKENLPLQEHLSWLGLTRRIRHGWSLLLALGINKRAEHSQQSFSLLPNI